MKRRTFLQLIGLSAVPGAMRVGRASAPVGVPMVAASSLSLFVSCGFPSASPFNVTSGTWIGNDGRSIVVRPDERWSYKGTV